MTIKFTNIGKEVVLYEYEPEDVEVSQEELEYILSKLLFLTTCRKNIDPKDKKQIEINFNLH